MANDPAAAIDAFLKGSRPIVFLTGAGISAESGIPTFRGPEGFWTIGSSVYRPEELATAAFFESRPEEQWPWYLWRRAQCLLARPNRAHEALVALEHALGDRYVLITQNVDGLHRRAGSSAARTLAIHGDIHRVRCSRPCSMTIFDMPRGFETWPKDRPLTPEAARALRCTSCGDWLRPHVLWFDECYDEDHFRAESALVAAREAGLLVVVGTTGATSLPSRIGHLAAAKGTPIIDINPEANVFANLAATVADGCALRLPATVGVPMIERLVRERIAASE